MRFFIFVFLLSLVSSGLSSAVNAVQPATPKNIILFIGDGMGLSQISAAKIVSGQLNVERFKHIGLLTTHSYSDLVTDSAASATAMATGYKTSNKMLSISADGKALKTVIEYAQENNKATGLVATSSITHATPAAFVAHVNSRKEHSLIAEQITQSGVDVLLGGGWGYFVPSTTADSKRWDNKNLLAQLALTTTVIQTEKELNSLGEVNSLVGLFSVQHLPKAAQRKPSLSRLTKKAIEILAKNNNGFFLMVEGSQIDWGGHENDQDYVISELMDLDKSIGIGLDFAESDQQTLVIVTADHETGGFAIHDGSLQDKQVTASEFTRTKHTATMVPVFAYGPGASDFSGIGDNTRIGKNIIRFLKANE